MASRSSAIFSFIFMILLSTIIHHGKSYDIQRVDMSYIHLEDNNADLDDIKPNKVIQSDDLKQKHRLDGIRSFQQDPSDITDDINDRDDLDNDNQFLHSDQYKRRHALGGRKSFQNAHNHFGNELPEYLESFDVNGKQKIDNKINVLGSDRDTRNKDEEMELINVEKPNGKFALEAIPVISEPARTKDKSRKVQTLGGKHDFENKISREMESLDSLGHQKIDGKENVLGSDRNKPSGQFETIGNGIGQRTQDEKFFDADRAKQLGDNFKSDRDDVRTRNSQVNIKQDKAEDPTTLLAVNKNHGVQKDMGNNQLNINTNVFYPNLARREVDSETTIEPCEITEATTTPCPTTETTTTPCTTTTTTCTTPTTTTCTTPTTTTCTTPTTTTCTTPTTTTCTTPTTTTCTTPTTTTTPCPTTTTTCPTTTTTPCHTTTKPCASGNNPPAASTPTVTTSYLGTISSYLGRK